MKTIRNAILIIILAGIAGILFNIARIWLGLNGLAFSTPWPDNREKVELETPPSYVPCDSTTAPNCDSLISLEQAYGLYLKGGAIFLDAREENEYDDGHIAGALNLPFELWDDYWASVEPELDPNKEIVVYCEGLDCELSLFEARELKGLGYEKAYAFFGGWQKWLDSGLPTEKSSGVNDEEYVRPEGDSE